MYLTIEPLTRNYVNLEIEYKFLNLNKTASVEKRIAKQDSPVKIIFEEGGV
jgi:hypothetical protein